MRYIDLFSGIGGFHVAMEKNGFTCVFACEINKHARQTYKANFNKKYNLENEDFFATDITQVNEKNIPDFEVLCAGFPCQAFSQAGHKKGFDDTRGTLFFDVARILKEKKPGYFILENVANLLNHDEGKTFKVISNTLKELGYSFEYKILKTSSYGLPQNRPRIYIVGFREKTNFEFPEPIPLNKTMSDILGGQCNKKIGYTLRVGGRMSPINDRHNWDGYIVNGEEVRLTINNAKEMQGFPSDYNFPVSQNQAMKQLGNSVSPVVIDYIVKNMFNINK